MAHALNAEAWKTYQEATAEAKHTFLNIANGMPNWKAYDKATAGAWKAYLATLTEEQKALLES